MCRWVLHMCNSQQRKEGSKLAHSLLPSSALENWFAEFFYHLPKGASKLLDLIARTWHEIDLHFYGTLLWYFCGNHSGKKCLLQEINVIWWTIWGLKINMWPLFVIDRSMNSNYCYPPSRLLFSLCCLQDMSVSAVSQILVLDTLHHLVPSTTAFLAI